MHGVLRRQLRKLGLEPTVLPESLDSWGKLLERVSSTYADADQDRYTLERSLEISSEEMRELHASLRIEHDKLVGVIRSLSDGLFVLDDAGNIVLCNPEAARILGVEEPDLFGRHISSFFGADQTGIEALRAAIAAADSYRNDDYRLITSHGSEVFVSVALNPFALDDHRRAFALVFRDMSEKKQFENELAAARDEAVRASRLKSEFVANMSHELRTPMSGIIGAIDLLLETRLDTEQSELARMVMSCADSLLTIINDILDFSKIEADCIELEEIPFDLRQDLEAIAELMATKAHQSGNELLTDVDPLLPPAVEGDPVRLRQIVTNLVGNAIKFTQDGEIIVRAALEEEEHDRIRIRFEIADTGIGIAPEVVPKLFDAFTQGDASTTRQYGGTGLGLAIAKRLVELMGGEIGVESELGSGSTFWFRVSLARSTATTDGSYRDRLHGRRILCVDDSETNLEILRRYLESWGARVETACGGPEAVERFRRAVDRGEPYELALLDMQMPGMDGLALSRIIRLDPAFGRVPLVLLTSIAERGLQEKVRRAGVDGFLTKPVRQSVLCNLVSTLLGCAVVDSIVENRLETSKPVVRGRVLLAEDNPVNQRVGSSMLGKLGYEVDVVPNGLEAVEAVEGRRYRMIFLDCHMPVMDGFEAARRIDHLRRERGLRLPVIAMTANAMQGDRERCLESSMDDYLAKPVRPKDLAEVVERWERWIEEGETPGEPSREHRPGPPTPAV